MGSDHLSVEVNSDGFQFPSEEYNPSYDSDIFDLLGSDIFPSENNTDGFCNSANVIESIGNSMEPNEFNIYFGPDTSSSLTYNIDQNLAVLNTLPIYGIDKNKKVKSNKKPIELSSSVGVGIPQRVLKPIREIDILYDLEEQYRPRYKSDYFAQNGKTRKPRYVTDRQGNHYVSLKVPFGVQGKIRVDWLTVPDVNKKRYVMPYRFQADNESADIPDCNPIFEDIVTDGSGIIKLYLVLIKTKQDVLKKLQPLQPFHPIRDVLGAADKDNTEKTMKYTPKKLIQAFQLGKSQLAFTLCPLSTDGRSCIPEWDTTVYSTVMEEEASENSTEKSVSCPKCSCEIQINDDGEVIDEIITTKNKRKSLGMKVEKPKLIKKQKFSPNEVYCFA